MNVIYDKKRGRVIDPETGVILFLNAYPDDADMGLEFYDPTKVERSPRSQKCHLAADFIFAESDPLKPSKRTVVGFRVRNVGSIGGTYYRNEAQKYARAREFIVAAMSAYLREADKISDPHIELV